LQGTAIVIVIVILQIGINDDANVGVSLAMQEEREPANTIRLEKDKIKEQPINQSAQSSLYFAEIVLPLLLTGPETQPSHKLQPQFTLSPHLHQISFRCPLALPAVLALEEVLLRVVAEFLHQVAVVEEELLAAEALLPPLKVQVVAVKSL
jgi:hypothetical protein